MATIKDVAELAGVAPSTVSYVLSGSRKISAETREAVRAAIAELGYHPRASARTLRSARSDVLVLAAPREAGKYRAVDGRFAVEVSDAVREHGYDVLMLTDPDGVAGLRRIARSGLADAAILMAVREADPRVTLVRELRFPTALLGHGDERGEAGEPGENALPWADLDWEAAVALAVRETVAAGHRHVLFLASAEHEIAARRRYALRGLAAARRAGRRGGAEVRVRPSSGDPDRLRALLRRELAARPAPTALIVQHLILLPELLAEVAALGPRVPEDLAVVLVGSLPDEPSVRALPRIELPVGRMSRAAVQLVVRALRPPDPGADVRGEVRAGHELIPPRMAEGAAIAPPSPRAHAP